MTLPSVTLTGTFASADGTPTAGRISFTPSAQVVDNHDVVVVPQVPVLRSLDGSGSFSVRLLPTDTAGLSPTGWAYNVTIQAGGSSPVTFQILLPSSPNPVDLSAITPAVPQPAVIQYVPLSGGTMNGLLVLSGNPVAPLGAVTKQYVDATSGGAQIAGDLGGTLFVPQVTGTHLAAPLPLAQGGTAAVTAAAARTSLGLGTAAVAAIDPTASDIQPLGTQAAGSSGLVPDAKHVHAMPRLDQVLAPTAAVGLNSQKITGLAAGVAGTDAANVGQIPASLPPSGSAGGDLTGLYPSPTLTGTANVLAVVRASRLDQMAAPTAAVALNAQKITGLANGVVSTDAAAFGQIPAALPPNGSATGDLGGTYPAPTVTATHLAAPLPIAQGGTAAATASAALANLSGTPASRLITSGTGLTGGGDLTADRTLAVTYGATAGTAAAGNDARITGAVQASTVTTKGDLLAATGNAAVARLAVGTDGQILTADSTQTAGQRWNSPRGPAYPVSGYGMTSLSVDPVDNQGSGGMGNGIWAARTWVDAGQPITNLWWGVRNAGTYDGTSTPNQLGLYDDTGVKIDNTAIDATLWQAAGWRGGAIVGGTRAAQAVGRFVYILAITKGMSNVFVFVPNAASDPTNTAVVSLGPAGGNRRSMMASGTALPASFDPTAYGTITSFIPTVGTS